MAITALATQNTTVGPAQFADMTDAMTAHFRVDSITDLRPSRGSGRTVNIAAGAGMAGGSRVRSTGTESVTLSPQSSGTRWDAVVLRVDWSTSAAQIVVVQGTSSTIPVNRSSAANKAQINRIPGVMYDALIAVARVGNTGIQTFNDMRLWGGDGGPYRVTDEALNSPALIDARTGTWIQTDQGVLTKRLDDDGVWRAVGTQANPWKTWTPTLRYSADKVPDGRSGTPVALGTGGQYRGRYRVVDNILDGFVSITTNAGNQFGTGQITMDLPLPAASWMPDSWSPGHIYTSTTNGGDKPLDWHSQALIHANWSQAVLFAPVSGDFNNMEPHRPCLPNGQRGTGVPFIVNAYSVGDVYTYHLSYPVGD